MLNALHMTPRTTEAKAQSGCEATPLQAFEQASCGLAADFVCKERG